MKEDINTALFEWRGPHGLPDFSHISISDFEKAFYAALEEASQELEMLASSAEVASIENFLKKYELSGKPLERICAIFWLYASTLSTAQIQKLETIFAPELSRFSSKWSLDDRLFRKIAMLYEQREKENYDLETQKVLERYYKNFLRQGVGLSAEDKQKLCEINEALTRLYTEFSQNVLKEEASWIHFCDKEDLTGLPEDLKSAMHEIAKEHGAQKPYALNLSRSIVEPFLTFSPVRHLRKIIYDAWIQRGENNPSYNNQEIIKKIVQLRQEKAKLLGFEDFAHYKIDNTMAKKPEAVFSLLNPIWEKARNKAEQEAKALQDIAHREGMNEKLAAWDWRYYTEKLRMEKYALDEQQIKSYFQLEKILEAAFACADKLFKLSFTEIKNVPLWHKEARLFLVEEKGKGKIGYFITDYFARPTKRSGAWMSALQVQHRLGNSLPIIYNICNFAKPAEGQKALLSMQDARTLFHEFGHALHGLLSDVYWPSIAGTAVARDFVELPSQLYEHWLLVPEILEKYAIHEKTGEKIPATLLEKILKAKHFNAGFEAVEFLSSALFDMYVHQTKEIGKISDFEAEILKQLSMPEAIDMRHRPTHFNHIFSGESYSAGYYSYMWSEVLDADAFEAFIETGDVFNASLAEKLKHYIYSSGGSAEPAELYKKFRGREASADALIRKRGL